MSRRGNGFRDASSHVHAVPLAWEDGLHQVPKTGSWSTIKIDSILPQRTGVATLGSRTAASVPPVGRWRSSSSPPSDEASLREIASPKQFRGTVAGYDRNLASVTNHVPPQDFVVVYALSHHFAIRAASSRRSHFDALPPLPDSSTEPKPSSIGVEYVRNYCWLRHQPKLLWHTRRGGISRIFAPFGARDDLRCLLLLIASRLDAARMRYSSLHSESR